MFYKKFFTLLSVSFFLQCQTPNKNHKSVEEKLKKTKLANVTINNGTNVFSEIVDKFRCERENLKSIIDEKTKKEKFDNLEKETVKQLEKKVLDYTIICARKFFINHTNFNDEEERRAIKKIIQNDFFGNSKNFVEEWNKGFSEYYKKYMTPENFSIFWEEFKQIFIQAWVVYRILEGDFLYYL